MPQSSDDEYPLLDSFPSTEEVTKEVCFCGEKMSLSVQRYTTQKKLIKFAVSAFNSEDGMNYHYLIYLDNSMQISDSKTIDLNMCSVINIIKQAEHISYMLYRNSLRVIIINKETGDEFQMYFPKDSLCLCIVDECIRQNIVNKNKQIILLDKRDDVIKYKEFIIRKENPISVVETD